MTNHYADAGVDVLEADRGISKITERIKTTWPKTGLGAVKLDIGYFANVVDLGDGRGLASTMDGVGSKTMIADMMDNYTTIGIDCVAMNVNDLICVGAKPLSMLDYIGVEHVDAAYLDEISIGLVEGARQAGISISGGEVSQLPDIIKGFDLVGAAHGIVDMDRIVLGSDVAAGDAIIGIASSGIHSNGMTLARRIFFEQHNLNQFDWFFDYGLERCLGDELLVPTEIYVQEVMSLLNGGFPVKALINITGDGLLNLNRIAAHGFGFMIDCLPTCHKIFDMIQEYGQVDDATMFQTFNMSVGFCVIVPRDVRQEAIDIIQSYGKEAWDIGTVVEDEYKSVMIPQRRLVGRGKFFELITP
jgi:phosphoribosylformylglycinamidine cyclo-ligase